LPRSIINSVFKTLLVLSVLAYGVFKTSLHLETQMDIRFYDESYYLCQGVFHPVSSWIADYSVLYSLYYKALHFVTGLDAISLYYLNYRIWAFLLSALVFFFLWKRGVHVGLCLIWALCSLSSEINYPLWPKAGHLAMLGVAVGILGIQKLGSRNIFASLWASGICLLLSWCRPEFLSGFFVGLVFFVLQVIFRKKAFGPIPAWIMFPFLASILCYFEWGLPFGGSGRGLVAFGQHYVHNWRNISGNNKGDLMWEWVNWREVFFKDFPGAQNMFQALVVNPKAFFMHLFFNFKHLFYRAFAYFFETLFPNRWFGIPLLYTVTICWILLEWSKKFDGLTIWLKRKKNEWSNLFHPVYILIFPSLLAGLLFQPRPHYILPLFPVFLWLVGDFLHIFSVPSLSLKIKNVLSLSLLAFLIFFLPDSSAYFKIQKKGTQNPKSFLSSYNIFEPITLEDLRQKELIRQLQQFPWPVHTVLFDGSTGAADFLGQQVIQKGKIGFELNYPELTDFEYFIKKEKVNAIFLRPSTMHYDRKINGNPFWQKLKASPDSLGWQKIKIGAWGDSLLLKR
jgi:hypothetical protein